MTPENPKGLLGFLLEGKELEIDTFNDFLGKHQEESLYHEYKDGRKSRKMEVLKHDLQRYISGFANSEGGVLVYGVTEDKPRKVNGCEPLIKETSLLKFAEDSLSLQPIARHLVLSHPRFQQLNHPDGIVLLVSVAASSAYVPCVEKKGTVYYFRFGQSTPKEKQWSTEEAETWLLTDLFQGRRRRPVLDLRFLNSPCIENREDGLHVTFTFRIDNVSMVTAKKIQLGLVMIIPYDWDGNKKCSHPELNPLLLRNIALDLDLFRPGGPLLLRPDRIIENLDPFGHDELIFKVGPVGFANYNTYDYGKFSGALFLMSETGFPVWYELTFAVEYILSRPPFGKIEFLKLEPVHYRLPKVSWKESD